MFMKGANGDVGAGARPAWWWNVVLSFADEQRAYVGWLAAVLKARAVRCFSTMPMSKPAVEEAPGRELPRTCVPGVMVFVSADYAMGTGPGLEGRA